VVRQIQRMLAHMAWADRQLLEVLRAGHGAMEPAVLRLFAHVLAAERVWLLRLRREDAGDEPGWPVLAVAELEALADRNAREIAHLVEPLEAEALNAACTYRNSQGTEFRTSVGDVLTHVFLHGSYHRGQIAAAIRAAGGQPVNTDFITWVRDGSP
jgi:uncharacterized damage-inducible protein DinB